MGFGKDGKGQILRENCAIALSTLADATAIKATSGGLAGNMQEDFRIIKSEIFVYVEGHTVGEGLITIGLADNELSVAEIAECLDVNGPVDRNDHLNAERVMRPVFEVCQIGETTMEIPNEGLPLEKTFRWTFPAAEGWCWFAYNDSGAALTTGTIVRIRVKHYGVWLT